MYEDRFVAEVRNIYDPWRQGRVQIRIYGLHDDEQHVIDEHLAWATILQTNNNPATAKIGTSPLGLIVGSRVFGFFKDKARQYPIVLGTYPRAAKPQNQHDNTGGQEQNDPKSKGIDLPPNSNATPPGAPKNLGLTANHPRLKQKPVDTSQDKYNAAQYIDNGTGVQAIKTAIQQFAPNFSKPTTASADPNLSLPQVAALVDSAGASSPLPTMLKKLAAAMAVSSSTSPVSTSTTVVDSLTGALQILNQELGLLRVVTAMEACLTNNGLQNIDQEFQQIVAQAYVNLIEGVVASPTTTVISTSASFTPTVSFLANLALTYTTQQIELSLLLLPFVLTNTLIPAALNAALEATMSTVQNGGMQSALGAKSSNSSDLASAIAQILGALGTVVNNTKNNQLPQSVLNQSSVATSLQSFEKNMAIIKQMKSQAADAFNSVTADMNSLVSSLTSSGLASAVTGPISRTLAMVKTVL